MLADASLQVQNIKLLPPEYPEDEVEESGVQDGESSQTDEETEEWVGSSIGSRFKYSLSDCDRLGNCEEQSDDDDDEEVVDLKGKLLFLHFEIKSFSLVMAKLRLCSPKFSKTIL